MSALNTKCACYCIAELPLIYIVTDNVSYFLFPYQPSLTAFCGLVVRVLGYRSGGPGSIPGTTRKKSSGSGTGSVQPREYNWGATWQKSSGSCLENRKYGRGDPSRWPRGTHYTQKLAITSPTSGGRSVSVVRSRTQTMEFVCFVYFIISFNIIKM
jgi:hypothetical protein